MYIPGINTANNAVFGNTMLALQRAAIENKRANQMAKDARKQQQFDALKDVGKGIYQWQNDKKQEEHRQQERADRMSWEEYQKTMAIDQMVRQDKQREADKIDRATAAKEAYDRAVSLAGMNDTANINQIREQYKLMGENQAANDQRSAAERTARALMDKAGGFISRLLPQQPNMAQQLDMQKVLADINYKNQQTRDLQNPPDPEMYEDFETEVTDPTTGETRKVRGKRLKVQPNQIDLSQVDAGQAGVGQTVAPQMSFDDAMAYLQEYKAIGAPAPQTPDQAAILKQALDVASQLQGLKQQRQNVINMSPDKHNPYVLDNQLNEIQAKMDSLTGAPSVLGWQSKIKQLQEYDTLRRRAMGR